MFIGKSKPKKKIQNDRPNRAQRRLDAALSYHSERPQKKKIDLGAYRAERRKKNKIVRASRRKNRK